MTTHARGYVDTGYLDAAARLAADGKRLSYERMRISPGARVLDVGCGPGTDTIPLAGLVGVGGLVAGLDHDAEMVARADERAAAAGVSARVDHRQGDAYALPWESAGFDAVRSERLLQHLAEPERAVAEMVRVARPGGRVVLVDTDWGSRSVDAPEPETERKMARFLAEALVANGYSGRRLYGLARRAGLAEVHADAVPLVVTDYGLWRTLSRADLAAEQAVRQGYATADELRRLDQAWWEMDREGTFFAVTTVVIVSGRKE